MKARFFYFLMNPKKRTFVFYLDWSDVINGQPDAIRLAVYDAIIEYVKNGNEPKAGTPVHLAFQFIKNQIDKDCERYAQVCEKRAIAGSKHKGNQHTNKRNKLEQTEQLEQMFQVGTNGTDYDNEYDNDNDNDNTTMNSSDIIKAEKSAKKKSAKQPKKKYGEFENVLLTDEEAQKLHNDFGDDAIGIVDFLSSYRAEKGYKNKSDYLSIKRWVANAYYEQLNKNKNGNYNNPRSTDYVSTERIVAAGRAMAEARN